MMEITIDEIKTAFARVVQHLEDTERTVFRAEVDYYWDVPTDTRYDNYDKPVEFTIGQISEEIRDVKKVAADDSEPIGDDLRCIGVVLRLIGETWTA